MDQQTKQSNFIKKATKKHSNLYDYTKVLYTGAHTKVTIICNTHGAFEQRPNDHLTGYGCKLCAAERRKATMVERYGVEHAQQSAAIKNKSKNTMVERYGVEHAQQSGVIRAKRHCNNIQKYGDNPSRLDEVKTKQANTNIARYGVRYTQQSPVVRSKARDTMVKLYGVEYALQVPHIYHKFTKTMIERYGVEHAMQCSDIMAARSKTIFDRYGALHPNQQHLIDVLPKLNDYNWLFTEYVTNNKTAQAIADELHISDATIKAYLTQHEIDIKYSVGFSYKCIQWLDHISANTGVIIQHALNGGEYKIPSTRWRADGYCADTNTVYEFHGDIYHGNPSVFKSHEKCHPWSDRTAAELYRATQEREDAIRAMGYNLVVIWEKEWYDAQTPKKKEKK